MSDPARGLLLCAAAFLDQGRTIDRLSRLLTAAALIAILIGPAIAVQPPWMMIGSAVLVALAGFAEMYLAIRVGFDAALFRQAVNASETPDFAGIDTALMLLGFLPAAKKDRPIGARIAGARRLFTLQILLLVTQVLAVFAGAWRELAH